MGNWARCRSPGNRPTSFTITGFGCPPIIRWRFTRANARSRVWSVRAACSNPGPCATSVGRNALPGGFIKGALPLSWQSPNLIHDHGIWLPANHQVAIYARERSIPRMVSPRGMLEPWAMRYKRWKKRVAWWLYQGRVAALLAIAQPHSRSRDLAARQSSGGDLRARTLDPAYGQSARHARTLGHALQALEETRCLVAL